MSCYLSLHLLETWYSDSDNSQLIPQVPCGVCRDAMACGSANACDVCGDAMACGSANACGVCGDAMACGSANACGVCRDAMAYGACEELVI